MTPKPLFLYILRPHCLARLAAGVGLWAVAGCRATVTTFGDTPENAQRNADELFAAFQYRFDNVAREPRFEAARLKMGRNALTPSRIFDDTSVWTFSPDSLHSRATYVRGYRSANRYIFTGSRTPTAPVNLGDQNHYLSLTWLGRGDYEWFTTVDHNVGHVRPEEVANAVVGVLTAAQGRTGQAAIADAAATFPHAAVQLAKLLDLDSLRTTILPDGSTRVMMGLTIRADKLRAAYPLFAAYLSKYIVPSVYRVQLADALGAFFDMSGRDGRVLISLRALDGHLVALSGTPRPLPDSLLLRSDFSAKYGLFRIGYTNLVGDFMIDRGEGVRAWNMRFRHEPEWHFPLAFDKLIRTSLRRPFQGNGGEMRLGVRRDLGGQTMSFRSTRVAVSESAIMRWLGRIGATAFGEFSGQTEVQENRFFAELFAALRMDLDGVR